MRDEFAPVIEGYDCDGITSPWSFRCEPFYEDGGNGGTMLDGTTVQDVLVVKNRFSWALGVLTIARYNALVSALDSGAEPDTVSAIVFDPATGGRYATTCHVTPPVFRFVIDINGEMVAVPDSALVLEETGYEKITFPIMGNDYTLYDDGTLEIDPLPDGSAEPEVDRWNRILDDLNNPDGDPVSPIRDVGRIVLQPGIPSLPSGVLDKFPNLEEIVIPPDVEIDPDAFDNCPNLTIIKIVSFPRKSDYIVGDALDYAGLSVIQISGGTEQDITLDCVLIPAEGYTTTEAGDIIVDVRYHDKSLGTFWLAVSPFAITSYPTNVNYNVGETLDYTGLVITETLPDGTTRDITADCVISPPEGTAIAEEGAVPVTVEYNGDVIATFEVVAERGVIDGGDGWTLYEDGTLSIYCTGNMPNYSYGNSPWYGYRNSITSGILSDSVTNIGAFAFCECSNLTSVTIPDSITSIGSQAFYYCTSLTSVTIPDSVTSIGSGAFFGCSGLTSVTIGSGVTSIGNYSFRGCTSLLSIQVESENATFSSEYGVLFNKDRTTLICYPGGKTDSLYWVPDGVTSIGSEAFFRCSNLTSVTIPDSVTSIGSDAFYYCTSLTSVTIPDSVTSIVANAFYYCRGLTSVTIGSGVTSIGDFAFYYCTSLTSVTIPDSVTSIGSQAFYYCTSLTSVTIGSGVTSIGNYSFSNCTRLSDVYYSGTKTQWNAISIGSGNTYLTRATIHYNSSP